MINKASVDQLEEAIDDFEENWSPESRGLIADLLNRYGLFDDPPAITEFLRIDIELRYKHGLSVQLDEYFDEFKQLLTAPSCVAEIAFEDFRSRYAHGYPVSLTRWRHLPGIRNESWFQQLASQEPATNVGLSSRALAAARVEPTGPGVESTPQADQGFQAALEQVGFRLVQEIGQGAFSRVYLATQQELADRYVVLKVVSKALTEPQNMAMLQHTNIVPIYSFHHILARSVICMPYAGSVTLEDFLKDKTTRDVRGGESLVVTVHNRVSDTTVACEANVSAIGDKPSSLIPAADERAVLKPLDQLRLLGCNDLALWIFGRLASALAHSHARGVLHGDLKPGNVLIRNDGEPALLDFNLSQTLDRPVSGYAGGTLPYMAPESLRALMGQTVTPDSSSDIYAIGVMLFEFVTARLPYPTPSSAAPIDLQPAIDARKGPPQWDEDDSVSPGLRSIINRALAFAPDDRYGSAEELQQDLDCERQSRSLLHADEGRRTRFDKWMRRHPRLVSSGSVGAMLLALLIPLGLAASAWRKQSVRMTALARFDAFAEESAGVLSTIMVDPRRHEGLGVAEAIEPLQKYGVLDGVALASFESPQMTEEQRKKQRDTLLRHVVQVGFTEADRLKPDFHQGPLNEQQLAQLDRLISTANKVCGDYVSRACVFLQAERARLAGDCEQSALLQAQADAMELSGDNEKYLEAVRLMSSRRWNDSLELLTALADRNAIPSNLRWTMVGRSQYNSGRAEDAKLSITQSIEHAPESSRLWFMRGLCYKSLDQHARAESDFSHALELEPSFVPAWLHRGVSRLYQGHFQEGIADFTMGLEYSPGNGQLLLNRHRAYHELGQTEQAEQDLAAVIKTSNLSAASLYARAKVLADIDPEQAVKDLEQAYALDPDRIPALTLQARIFSTRLNQRDQAIEILDRCIELDPNDETPIIDRAVLLSQAGRFGQAKHDIERAMQPPNYARSLYQAACASAHIPEELYRRQALSFLARAINAGYKPDKLANDPDLDPIRDMDGFQAIRRAYLLANLRRFQQSPSIDDAPE